MYNTKKNKMNFFANLLEPFTSQPQIKNNVFDLEKFHDMFVDNFIW